MYFFSCNAWHGIHSFTPCVNCCNCVNRTTNNYFFACIHFNRFFYLQLTRWKNVCRCIYDSFLGSHHPVCRIHCAIVRLLYIRLPMHPFYYNGSWHVCYAYSLAFFGIQYHFKDFFVGRWGILIHSLHTFILYIFQYNCNAYKRNENQTNTLLKLYLFNKLYSI